MLKQHAKFGTDIMSQQNLSTNPGILRDGRTGWLTIPLDKQLLPRISRVENLLQLVLPRRSFPRRAVFLVFFSQVT